MAKCWLSVTWTALWFLPLIVSADEAHSISDEKAAFFETKIRPVLVERCYECHSADAKIVQGGLLVDRRDGLRTGGDSGASLVPGMPEQSLLIKALRHDGIEMPPNGKLPDTIVQDFQRWVAMGAPDPRTEAISVKRRAVDVDEGRKHWAFQPVVDASPPTVDDESWPLESVDRFVLARLEAAELHPSTDADRYTWLRRVTLDLTGLPPSPEEIAAFVGDDSPLAYERVVDRLLASRTFGERWARHWLDLTGYADQIGTSNNLFAEHAWRYRDYLIEAFNDDKPYDTFVQEQIAGDLMSADEPAERASQIVATGFLVLGDVDVVNPDKQMLEADLVDQQVNKVGQVFMGMTLGCVRCHDHKFDPISQDDYYALAGMFRSTTSTCKIPYGIWSGVIIRDLPETPEQLAERRQREVDHKQRIRGLRTEQTQLEQEKAAIATKLAHSDADQAALNGRRGEIDGRLGRIAAEILHAEFFAPAVPKAYAVVDAAEPADMPIYIRGNPHATGKVIRRGVFRVASWKSSPTVPTGQSGRLQLAEWITDPRHPLTSRVAANRIWQKLFGKGIVPSVDYFGVPSEAPSHPELLDHLASRFIEDGWSQKRLIRTLVLSRTYRMGSGHNELAARRDPDNRLLWRMSRSRLDAEAIRDSLLAVSGQLLPGKGGPALPLEYMENTNALAPGDVNPPSFTLRRFRPTQEFERTIYLPVVRSEQPGPTRLRDVFDFTQPAQIAGERAQTVVPTQALFLLNNDLVRSRARALAERLITAVPEGNSRLDQLWLRALNRPITDAERNMANNFLQNVSPLVDDRPNAEIDAWTELCHAVLESNEFIFRL